MKLALLGATEAAFDLAIKLRRAGHSIAAAFDAGPLAVRIRAELPSAETSEDWERLLDPEAFDGVVVAGPLIASEIAAELRLRREEQLRKLFQSRIPLLVIGPACESIVGFELEMIRRDLHGIAVPYVPEAIAPVFQRFSNALTRNPEENVGPLELVQFERFLTDRSRTSILEHFSRDCDAIRRSLGSIRRVTATGGIAPENEKPSLAGTAVNLDGFDRPPIRWTALPAGEFQGLKITLIGSAGTIRWEIPADHNAAMREFSPAGETRELPPHDGSDELIAYFERLVNAQSRNETSLPLDDRFTSWNDACRVCEATEAIDRSLARRRCIELFNEEHSEESSFRGVMSAIGCMLLLIGPIVYFGLGFFLAAIGYRDGNKSIFSITLPYCFFAPFALFLLLQLLAFGLKRHRAKKTQVE